MPACGWFTTKPRGEGEAFRTSAGRSVSDILSAERIRNRRSPCRCSDKGNAGFYQEIGNIKSDLILYAHTKNQHSLSKQRHLAVLLTPKLERAVVQIAPPTYTGLKAEEKPFEFKSLRALAGAGCNSGCNPTGLCGRALWK